MIHCSTNSNQVTDCVCSVLLLLLHLLDLIISIPPICLYIVQQLLFGSTVILWPIYARMDPSCFTYLISMIVPCTVSCILYITLHAAI